MQLMSYLRFGSFACAAMVPFALGLAMHQSHAEMQRACELASAVTDRSDAEWIGDIAVVDQPPSLHGSAYGRGFMFANESFAVLAVDVDPSWSAGFPADARLPDIISDARVDALPEALKALQGTVVDVYGDGGRVCTARLGELHVLSRTTPFALFHGSRLSAGDEQLLVEALDEETDAVREAIVSRLGWQYGQQLLVASLRSDSSCAGALWARDAELVTPQILVPSRASADELDYEARERLLASSDFADVRRQLEGAFEEPVPLEEDAISVRVWRDHLGRARRVDATLFTHEPWGESYPLLVQLSSVDGSERPTTSRIDARPSAMFDLEGDGRFESISGDWDEGLLFHGDEQQANSPVAVITPARDSERGC